MGVRETFVGEDLGGGGNTIFFVLRVRAGTGGLGLGGERDGRGGKGGCTHTLDDDVESVSQSVSQLDLS